MLDTAMELPDGRVLAYTDCGAPTGPPVIYFHGAPMSRLDLVGSDDAFRALGVRNLSPDRPGYGGSSPQPGRGLDDWPADVLGLADHLGLDRFAVIGWSSGGPYAVACAALLPDRVCAAGVVAGVTDFGWDGAWDGYVEAEVTVMRLADESAATDWYTEHYGADGAGLFDEDAGDFAPADAAMFEDEAMAAGFFATAGEAFRQGVAGYAQDVTVQGRPWPFDPAMISVPVSVLHGEADTLVPIAHSRHTTEVIPTATLTTFADHGHLSIVGKIPQLAAELARAVG
ncbi:MAG: alpha/beta hydrolase [Acidimicrobiia bacterium]|nr:alpha/beta hydrolase [Acidimicrobiia bacterium]